MSTTWGVSTSWGGRGIWDNGPSVSLPQSAVATRESSQSRKQSQQAVMSPLEEPEPKSGSGSLVDGSSSLGGRPPFRPSFGSNWGSSGSSSQLASQNGLASANTSHQRSISSHMPAQPLSAASQSFSSVSRPSPISLNPTSTAQQRPGYGMASSARSNEQPPTVYTKFDRPVDPFTKSNRQDSAFATNSTWDRRSTPTDTPRVSPLEERHPQSFGLYRTGSLSTSRDHSQHLSRHSDQQSSHGQELPRHSQAPTAPNTRATSFATQCTGSMNSFGSQGLSLAQVEQRLGQLGLNGNSRPSTSSYKQTCTSNGFGMSFGTMPPAGSTLALTRPGAYAQEDVEEIDHAKLHFMGTNNFSPQQGPGDTEPRRAGFGSRFGQTPGSIDLRNVQSFVPGASQARSFISQIGPRSPEWQSFSNGAPVANRRSPSLPDPQAYLDPRIQELVASQLRGNGYAAPVYSPYAVLNGMQLPPLPPYLNLLPMPVPVNGVDPNAAMREVVCGDGVQSALMYEFKSNTKTKRYELKDIYNHIAEFSGDQHGSRFIQTKLETANSDEKDRVFREIEPNAIPLMTDVYGNYVIQKFFEHGDQTHKKILANKMRGQVLNLSLQMYGCRVVQKALDHVLVDQQAVLIGELESHVLRCVKDQNGNHVIQKAIERCPPHTIQFIINAFRGQVMSLSIHPYGCRVIQRCLERCDMLSKATILDELMEPQGIPSMISDQYGNYVVQHVVLKDDGRGKMRVLQIVLNGLEGFSKHKFASNVVEKCLEQADDFWRRQVVWKLDELQRQQRRVEGEGVLVSMIKDNFGNYVIQKLLDTLGQQDFWDFIDLLSPAMQQAKRTGCGKQVQSIEKKMHRFPPRSYGGNNHQYNNYQLPLPTPVYGSHFGSAANTPPPLTADTQSLQSSAIPSINGDAVEGADSSRKSSESSNDGREAAAATGAQRSVRQ